MMIGSLLVAGGCGFDCSKTDRRGEYRAEFFEIEGSCGDIPTAMVPVTAELPDGCALEEADRWSNDLCTLKRTFRCRLDDGSHFIAVAETTQETEDGSHIQGTIQITFVPAHGQVCMSTYDIEYERVK
jgi:hypothetical protein